ncbi:MAG: hypothetical protein HFI57_04380 [Lachnospiraceae bacterium]|nr:hypothetical protein [Lachnospiraceae bacterium]
MIRFRKHFEDLIFQCGMPCAGYIPHMYNKHKYLCDNHKIDAMLLYAAVDNLFLDDSEENIIFCMRQISSICSRLLLYGSRRLNAVRKKNKRKEGTKNE